MFVVATTNTKWKAELKKIVKNINLQFWQNPELMLSKPSRYHHVKLKVAAIKTQVRNQLQHSYTWTQDKVKVTILKKLSKIEIFKIFKNLNMWHTFWSWLIRCANMKWIRLVLWMIQSRHDSVHRQTDGRTDGLDETSIPHRHPFNFVEAGGYNDVNLM